VQPIGVYAHDGLWYMPALLLSNEKILLFRDDRIHAIEASDESNKTTMNLQQWLERAYEPQHPMLIYVELS
ncbi:WYL domain-containing protein, partial [Lysinibacillus fusiformis]|uniref:WYL domain-containing protein n=1 Tax=Lysinibacillus fusiformis TaxID=28031 RepID=UPI0020BDBB77